MARRMKAGSGKSYKSSVTHGMAKAARGMMTTGRVNKAMMTPSEMADTVAVKDVKASNG